MTKDMTSKTIAFTIKSPNDGSNIELANNAGLNNFDAYNIDGSSK